MATDYGFVILIGISKGSHAVDPAGFFPKIRRGIAPVTNTTIAVALLNAGDPAVDKYVVLCFKIVQHGRNDFLIEHGLPGSFSKVIVMEAGKTVKVEGKDNNLLELIAADPAFNLSLEDLQRSMDPKKYIGRAKEQTERFVNTVVQPILDSHKELLGVKAEINV